MEDRKRHNITFCLDIDEHRRAYEAFREAGCRTDYIVYCINRANQAVTLDDLQTALNNISIQPAEKIQKVDDIPDDVMDILNGEW